MSLGRFRSVVRCVLVVAAGQVRVMRRRFVPPCFMVRRSFPMVSRRVFVMLCCFVMMLDCFL